MSAPPASDSLEDGIIETVVVLGFVSHAEYVTFLGTETHAQSGPRF